MWKIVKGEVHLWMFAGSRAVYAAFVEREEINNNYVVNRDH